MNKKITGVVISALMIAGLTSFTAFAAMPEGTVTIGNKSFDLAYANNITNTTEITNAIVQGGAIYVKDFSGNWIDNTTGSTVNVSIIPAVVYKSSDKEINFDAQDKDQGSKLTITSVSAINDINVVYGTAIANVGLPSKITLKLSNNTTADVAVAWTCTTYDKTKTASYIFTGTYALPEGVTGTMPNITETVVVGANTVKTSDIGKTVTIPNELFGTYEMTINSIKLDNFRNPFNDTNPVEVYKVNYTYKLLEKGSATDVGLFLYGCFNSVDSTGEAGFLYPGITNNDAKELVIIGSRCTADTFIAVKNKTTSLTLILNYQIPNGSTYETFNIPVDNATTPPIIQTPTITPTIPTNNDNTNNLITQQYQDDLASLIQQIQNVKDNKNIQILEKQTDGMFQFVYTFDQSKVDSLQKLYDAKLSNYNIWLSTI